MKKELFEELVESIEQAGQIRKGLLKPSRVFRYRPVEVKRIRNKLHVSQSQFAMMIGVSKSTLQNWEQGRREPEGPAKALLRVVDKNPKAVLEALQAT
jgi:putative transcriptional regulator